MCRREYLSKSKTLQDQLKDLKSEIEVLKVEDKTAGFDRFHDESIQRGDSKYSTLLKVMSSDLLLFHVPGLSPQKKGFWPTFKNRSTGFHSVNSTH